MTEAFDPYHKWLGIPPGRRPPNHYEMLGIALFESDLDVISNAADRRMSHIKTFAGGPQAKISQLLLNQLSEARICLCSQKDRIAYDRRLRQELAAKGSPAVADVKKPSVSSKKSLSDSTLIGLGSALLVASMVVTYLAFTQGPSSFREAWSIAQTAYANATAPQPPQDNGSLQLNLDSVTGGHPAASTKPDSPDATDLDSQPNGTSQVEGKRVPNLAGQDLPNQDDSAATDTPRVAPAVNPPSPELYEELTNAFDALLQYDYGQFRLFRNAAEKRITDQRLDPQTAGRHLATLDEIGDGFATIWKLVDAVIPTLERRETLKLGTKSNFRVITAVPGRLQLQTTGRKKRLEYQAQTTGKVPVFKDMPPVLATYLAKRAIEANLLAGVMNTEAARHAMIFFREIDPESLSPRPRTRWSMIESVWEESQ